MLERLLAYLSPYWRGFALDLWERRMALGAFVGAVGLVAFGISFVLPSWYRAEARLLPPSEGGDSFGVMSSLIQASALNKLGMMTTATPSDVFADILKGRTLRERLVEKHGLVQRYKARNMDLALRELDQHIAIETTKSGIIILSIEDRSAAKAAEMTNDLVTMLDAFNQETFSTKARRTREFLATRLAEVRSRLVAAESTLTSYERRHGMLLGPDATAAQSVAGVMAQKVNLQVRRSYVASFSRAESPALKEIDAEMAAVDRELTKLPPLKQEGARLVMDAELQRRVFMLLTAQYEDARVQESRDTPTISVLDAARAPMLRARPRRAVIVAVSVVAAALLFAAWIALRRAESPGTAPSTA